MESLNRMAVELVDEAIDFADELAIEVVELDNGAVVLDFGVEAGHEKQETVAAVNGLQSELAVSVEAAAVLYAHSQGIDVQEHAKTARSEL